MVDNAASSDRRRHWRGFAWLWLAVLAMSVLSVLPYVSSSSEMVRVRHALMLLDPAANDFSWTPATTPTGFLRESGPVDAAYAQAGAALGLGQLPDDWARAVAISRHLLSHKPLTGGAIQSDLRDTYRQIVNAGGGYCGDFTRTFMGFALAAGIPVRAWAFSFDGYGGSGHIWPEIWNRQLGRWQLVDTFNNFYFHRGDGVAVSALEFRQLLTASPRALYRSLLSQSARPGYVEEEKMWSYYERGLPEWYMVWGNNVFSYDSEVTAFAPARWSRALEQLYAVATGVQPGIKLFQPESNNWRAASLRRLRTQLLIVLSASAAAIIGLVLSIYQLRAGRTPHRGGK